LTYTILYAILHKYTGTIWYWHDLYRSGTWHDLVSGTWHDQIWYLARSDNYLIADIQIQK
jgi:hypothetical protein